MNSFFFGGQIIIVPTSSTLQLAVVFVSQHAKGRFPLNYKAYF